MIDLTNYGPGVLFKMEDGQNGENTIKINRGHRAYKLWSETESGKKYFTVMMYALTETTKKCLIQRVQNSQMTFQNILERNLLIYLDDDENPHTALKSRT